MKAVIWGAGDIAADIVLQRVLYCDYSIKAVIDNDNTKWGSIFYGFRVLSPDALEQINPKAIIVCSKYYMDIKKQIEEIIGGNALSIDIIEYKDLYYLLNSRLKEKYKDTEDEEIRLILDSYSQNGFSVYGSYTYVKERYRVLRDSDHMPYVIFEDKRMYFPRFMGFKSDSSGEYIEDILKEQQFNSPHLYVRDYRESKLDGIIVDAGVCEGNFALRYVEKAKKMYLIESDEKWIEPLEKTFKPYSNKVVLCNKYLSNEDSRVSIKLDSLVSENIDFLKIDIEGAEVDALEGAMETLTSSNSTCAICSYHRYNDEEKIKRILQGYGYTTSTSLGYMFFTYDPKMAITMDFRRGIVYGDK